jgi:DNA modification methylase
MRSRSLRDKIIERLGGEIPTTIWVSDYSEDGGTIELQGKTAYQIANEGMAKKVLDGTMSPFADKDAFRIGFSNIRGSGRLSVFPYNICKKAVLFYSEKGEIVLDPCAGHNSRMQTTWELGRGYIGYDVAHCFMEFNRGVADRIQKADSEQFFKRGGPCLVLHEQSSEHMEEADNSVHFVFTSPPYWALEHYDDNPAQLGWKDGKPRTYIEFLDGIQRVAAESFRVLKSGRFCAININDFRYEGKFYLYHMDLAARFLAVGFEMHDVAILAWSTTPFSTIFAERTMKNRMLGKSHEYILIFKKPGGDAPTYDRERLLAGT